MATISPTETAIGGSESGHHRSNSYGYDGLTARTNYHPTEQIVRGSSRATPFHTRSAGSVSQGSNRGSPTDYVSTDGGMVQDLIAGSESNSSKSPLASFGFLKNLTGDKKTTKDGQTPKRRGPKPDSKPALTRRQELNRQAQRTHRERKEMYIKALEQEVLRLKEVFANTARERDRFAEENRKLRDLLAAHGISIDGSNLSPGLGFNGSSTSYGGSSSGSVSGSYNPRTNSTGMTSPPSTSGLGFPSQSIQGQPPIEQLDRGNMDYGQIGIDFVLTLERPCLDHAQFLLLRSQDAEGSFSGHVLNASCPPESHIHEHPEEKYPHKMPDVSMNDLLKLLDLSNRLPLDGEITPIMAWASILQHPRVNELTKEDFQTIKEDLLAKVRCYGFGAVLEEFEVRDALSIVFATKIESYAAFA